MSTVATEHKKLGEEIQAQEMKLKEMRLSGEQEGFRKEQAQAVLHQLQVALMEGETPGTEALSDALLKTEQFLTKQAQSTQIDTETRKALEDMAVLVGSAKQMARHKDLGDRLQRISDETAKALKEVAQPGVSPQTRTATMEALQWVQTWRPVFELLMASREFRMLITDSVKIFREVMLRHQGDVGEKVEERFMAGQPVGEIAKDITVEAKESFKAPSGEVNVKMSDEEWDKLHEDMTRVLVTLGKTPQYKEGIERMFHLLDMLRGQMGSTSNLPESAQPHAKRAQVEAEELVAAFAGRKPLDKFMGSLKNLMARVENDENAKSYLKELREFILDSKTAEHINEKEYKERMKSLSQRGRDLVYEYKYDDDLNDFLNKSNDLMEAVKNDEFVKAVRHHAGVVVSDLSYVDTAGNVQIDTQMLGKIQAVIAPVIAESLKYIPIPKIESDDENRHFWVDNIVLCGYDILPENIRVQLETDTQINIREAQTDKAKTRLLLTLNNIRTELKDLEFYYLRKSFPQLEERGKVTIRLPGAGATLFIAFQMDQVAGSVAPIFREGTVNFQIHKLDIEYDKQTLSHDILVPLITNMFKYQIQRQIETQVERSLGGLVHSIGERLTSALSQVNQPIMAGMDTIKQVVKTSEVGQVYEKRREKLE